VLAAGEQADEFEGHLQAARAGDTRRFESTFYNARTEEERHVVLTYSPILEDGKVVSVLGVARDVTDERRVAERSQQADKLRALGQLASGVAHDVNNDLAAILGRVQRLLRDSASGPIRRDLEIIETAALDSAQTVRRIQNFARQQGISDFQPVDLNGLVHDAIEITRTRWLDDARSRGIHYTVECDASDLSPVLGDGSQLREVFVNLIINAGRCAYRRSRSTARRSSSSPTRGWAFRAASARTSSNPSSRRRARSAPAWGSPSPTAS
jgi:signal transduction histidine kinase